MVWKFKFLSPALGPSGERQVTCNCWTNLSLWLSASDEPVIYSAAARLLSHLSPGSPVDDVSRAITNRGYTAGRVGRWLLYLVCSSSNILNYPRQTPPRKQEGEMATQIGTPSVRGGRREESNVGYTEDFAMTDWSDSPWRQDDERANRTGLTEPGSTDEAAGNPHEYARRRPSNATERSTIERPMGVLDVAAVIINKMVGTGIFTVPGQVLVSTGDKKISLILWAMGGIWTAAWYPSQRS